MIRLVNVVLAAVVAVTVCASVGAGAALAATVTVTLAGDGSGIVTSSPQGIDCGWGADATAHSTCSFTFDPTAVPMVTLAATPDPGTVLSSFGDGCLANPCTISTSDVTVPATFDVPPTITEPVNGANYAAASVPVAEYTCAPGATCTATLDGQAYSAATAATPGQHTLRVTGVGSDGVAIPATVTYTVNPPPTCSNVTATTNEGTPVNVTLSCGDPNAPVGYQIASGPGQGTASLTGNTVTYTPGAGFSGTDTFTYLGTSANGTTAPSTASVTVLAPPTAHITVPTAGEIYTVGQSVSTHFACADDPAGPGIQSCVDSGGATNGTGTVDTSTEGHHTYTVTATSRDGQSGTATIDYTVVGKAPQVVITTPVDNAAYLWTAIPAADYECVAGVGSNVQSCTGTAGGQAISDHQALPNGFGVHTLTVTATDADGLSTSATATYTVTSSVSLAPISIKAPREGAAYRLGQVVAARYSCLAPTTGPALKSCVGTVRAGRPINTRTLGRHEFDVSATNSLGDSTTERVTYSVVPPTNRIVVIALSAARSGEVRLRLVVPGPGSVRVRATAWNAAPGASKQHVAYGVARTRAHRRGPLAVAIAPSAAGRALLRVRGARPVVSLVVTFTPIGAKPHSLRLKPLRLTPG